MSSRELSEWMAYEMAVEPIGEVRADLRAGVVASTIANVNRDQRKKPRPYTPYDFVLKFDDKKAQTPEEMIEIARTVTDAMTGGDDGDNS